MHDPIVQRIAEGAIQVSWPALIDRSIHQQVMAWDQFIQENPFNGWIENVPAYHTLTIYFDPLLAPDDLEQQLTINHRAEYYQGRVVDLPVCYDPSLGIDLERVSEQLKLSREEIIHLHTSTSFSVFMIGFLPGFPYMGLLPHALEIPRKSIPSPSIPEGAVAIAGKQTGIYPVASPGGWHVIGQTPWPMFRDGNPLLKPGDEIQFSAIDLDAFYRLKKHFLTAWPSI